MATEPFGPSRSAADEFIIFKNGPVNLFNSTTRKIVRVSPLQNAAPDADIAAIEWFISISSSPLPRDGHATFSAQISHKLLALKPPNSPFSPARDAISASTLALVIRCVNRNERCFVVATGAPPPSAHHASPLETRARRTGYSLRPSARHHRFSQRLPL